MKDSLGSAIVSSTMLITRGVEVELPLVNRKVNGAGYVKSAPRKATYVRETKTHQTNYKNGGESLPHSCT